MMKIKNKILAAFLLVLNLLSCSLKSNSEKNDGICYLDSTTSTPINNTHFIDSLKLIILKNGDPVIYNQVHSYYSLETRDDEFLYYSMIMAHKYNHASAYYDVFFALAGSEENDSLKKIDIRTKYLALFYLLKFNELGVKSAHYYVESIFGETNIPKSNYYLQELSKLK